ENREEKQKERKERQQRVIRDRRRERQVVAAVDANQSAPDGEERQADLGEDAERRAARDHRAILVVPASSQARLTVIPTPKTGRREDGKYFYSSRLPVFPSSILPSSFRPRRCCRGCRRGWNCRCCCC